MEGNKQFKEWYINHYLEYRNPIAFRENKYKKFLYKPIAEQWGVLLEFF